MNADTRTHELLDCRHVVVAGSGGASILVGSSLSRVPGVDSALRVLRANRLSLLPQHRIPPPKNRLWTEEDLGIVFSGEFVVTHYRLIAVRRWETKEQALADHYFGKHHELHQ